MKNKHLFMVIMLSFLLLMAIPIIWGTEESCSSVKEIIFNKTPCDRKEVEVIGEVVNLKFAISKTNGNKYTTFNFNEGNETLTIFSYGYLPVAEKDIVKVKGAYFTNYLYENYTFPDQINTIPSNFLVLKTRKQTLLMYGGFVLSILLIIIIFFLIKKNREKFKKKQNYLKGHGFEKYALNLFKPGEWEIEHVSGDLSEELGRRVKSDSDPDLIVKNISKNVKLALECKYFSSFAIDKNGTKRLFWARDYKIEHYHKFQNEKGVPVSVLIGLGGSFLKPERTFLIDLNSLRFSFVREDYLQKFERKVEEPFYLENNTLR